MGIVKGRQVMDLAVQEAGKRLQEEIDATLLNNIIGETLMKHGWKKAPFDTSKFTWPMEYKLDDVVAWMHVNATGAYKVFGNDFWFQRDKDLTAFVLRWA